MATLPAIRFSLGQRLVLLTWGLGMAITGRADPMIEVAVTVKDLEALTRQQAWSEVVVRAKEIPPMDRDAAWRALATRASLEYLRLLNDGDPLTVLSASVTLMTEYPFLVGDRGFLRDRNALALGAAERCYENPFVADQCGETLVKVVQGDMSNTDFGLKLAAIAAAKGHFAHALALHSLLANPATAAQLCARPDVAESALKGLGSSEWEVRKQARRLVDGLCWEQMAATLEGRLGEQDGKFREEACRILKRRKKGEAAPARTLCAAVPGSGARKEP